MKPHLFLFVVMFSLSQSTFSQSHMPLTEYPIVTTVDIQKDSTRQPAKYAHILTDEHIGSAVLLPSPLPPKSKPIGHTTRQLLQYQRDTTRQANEIPMLGVTATKSWNRYLNSFDQPLPEWFTEHINESNP